MKALFAKQLRITSKISLLVNLKKIKRNYRKKKKSSIHSKHFCKVFDDKQIELKWIIIFILLNLATMIYHLMDSTKERYAIYLSINLVCKSSLVFVYPITKCSARKRYISRFIPSLCTILLLLDVIDTWRCLLIISIIFSKPIFCWNSE